MGERRIDAPSAQEPPKLENPVFFNTPLQPIEIPEKPVQNQSVKQPEASGAITRIFIAKTAIGLLAFGIGIYMAFNSKTAVDFSAFYWSIIYSNIFTSVGIVMLYHSILEIVDIIRALIEIPDSIRARLKHD